MIIHRQFVDHGNDMDDNSTGSKMMIIMIPEKPYWPRDRYLEFRSVYVGSLCVQKRMDYIIYTFFCKHTENSSMLITQMFFMGIEPTTYSGRRSPSTEL